MDTKPRPIILGTRGSELALTQARLVKAALEQVCDGLEIVLRVIVTTGDRRTDLPLSEVAKVAGIFDKGVFLKEIEWALESGEIDLAVHSLKDMPSESTPGLMIAGVLPRASVEDVLVSRAAVLPDNPHLATGSVRRRSMARLYWGEQACFSELRGNVPTRLSKLLAQPDLDGIILARAGLERLGLYRPRLEMDGGVLHLSPLPEDVFVPAAGQGVIAVQTRADDALSAGLVSKINDPATRLCARAERKFLRMLGADCSTPVGAYACLDERSGLMVLHVALYREEDVLPVLRQDQGPFDRPEELAGRVFQSLDELR